MTHIMSIYSRNSHANAVNITLPTVRVSIADVHWARNWVRMGNGIWSVPVGF